MTKWSLYVVNDQVLMCNYSNGEIAGILCIYV